MIIIIIIIFLVLGNFSIQFLRMRVFIIYYLSVLYHICIFFLTWAQNKTKEMIGWFLNILFNEIIHVA